MRKILHTIFTLVFLLVISQAQAQVNNVAVDAGPYTPGSSIAVTFSLGSSCIAKNNTFELYLSDATGSFASEVKIGELQNTFYATFINGQIPSTAVIGAGYRVRIKATNPAIISGESGLINIIAGAVVEARLTAPNSTISTNPVTFGNCETDETQPNTTFSFVNSSSSGNTTVTIKNELDPGNPAATLTFTSIGASQNYTAALAHYTMYVRTQMPDGTIGTKAYFLINNIARTAFTTSGGNTVCFPTGAFEYIVNIAREDGIGLNFPGNTYHIDWGDGLSSDYSLCDITSNSNRVGHSFAKSSCGLSYTSGTQTIYNAFGVNVGAISPYCGPIGSPLSTPARVVSRPENRFAYPPVACLNDNVIFVNQSLAGERASTNSPGCADNNVSYSWFVDGIAVPYAQNQPLTYNLQVVFTTKGKHTVTLTSQTTGNCQAVVFEREICIQDPPTPSFTLPANTLCLNAATLTPTNTSLIDNTCPNVAAPVYTWTVTGPGSVGYGAGTTANSITPTFVFSQIGVYSIILNIRSATCNRSTVAQEVVVNTTPTIDMSPEAKLCTQGGTFVFGPTSSPTQTTSSGTAQQLADTYTWTVTGATTYSFGTAPGSDATSQYPTITFSDYGTYLVTLIHKNNCGTETKSQPITFSRSPIPTITVDPTVCYNKPITVQGRITNGTYDSFTWTSNIAGTFANPSGTFADPSALNTTFTPTDLSARSATITLTVNTGIPGNCLIVRDIKTVTIFPNNTGTNATQVICSGDNAVYTPVSSVSPSTFKWTAAVTNGAATGFSLAGTGNINEAITNSSTTAPAEVTYTITPMANGCDGIPYTFIVTINPRPITTFTASSPTICSNQPTGILLTTSNLTGTTYRWTSVATNGTSNTVTGNTNPTGTAATINDILINNGTTQGSVIYTITPISAAGCSGTPVTITINVDPALTVADAGQPESICNLTTFTLKGNQPIVGTGTWRLTSGQTGVTITSPNDHNSGVTGLVGGQDYTFEWSITAMGACTPTVSTVLVSVNIPTVGGTTATPDPVTVCEAANTGTITLTGNVGAVIRWESSTDGGANWTPIANTTNTFTYTNITVATQYRAVVKNGQCNAENSTPTSIAVTRATTIAAAGLDQAICAQLTTVLEGNTPNSGDNGLWTIVAGSPNATFTDATNPKTTVTGLIPGQNYTFRWTITGLSPCGPTADEVLIINHLPLTNIISSTNTEVCNGQLITITGSTPTGGDGSYAYIWESSTDGSNWTTITGQTAKDLSYTLTTTLNFRRTVISSTCTLVSNVVTIIAQSPISNNTIAADQSICTGIVPSALIGSTPAGSNGVYIYQWQSSLDNVNWTDISGAVFKDYTPQALTASTYFRRVVSTTFCSGPLTNTSAAVTITVRPNAKAEFTYTLDKACTPFVIDAANIRAIAYPDRNATYTWYANNVVIGTGITFPGYTISTSNSTVTIKLVTTPSTGCLPDEMSHDFSTNEAVAATFTQSATQGCGPLVVNFVNTSPGLTTTTFRWDFGNGTTSTQAQPAAVTYLPEATGKDTTYTVTLTATTTCGTSSITSTVFIKAKPISIFSPSRTEGCSPMKVTFTNTSPGSTNTYYYDFGDGTLLTKTDRSAVEHTYIVTATTDFTVKMIAENDCGRDESSYVIRVSPQNITPLLVVNGNEKSGCAPLTVNFRNNTVGASRFTFDFGDGGTANTITTGIVQHTYTRPGTYTVTMTAYNSCSEIAVTESITVLQQPAAAFDADIKLGCPGLSVKFSNTTQDGFSYLWDFGDGTTSDQFEPVHVFNGDQEYYTVTLTATNTLGCAISVIKNQFIHIVQPPVAKFNVNPSVLISIPNYTFRFEDESTGNPTAWAWDFGDGVKSTLQNPSHTYLDTGSYVVTLLVSNQQGCFTTTFKTVTIAGVPGYLYVPNSFMPGSETPELRVFMAKGSGIKSWTMSVFNKWGQTLWQTTKLDEGRPVEWWDGVYNGVPVPQGVYFWKIDVELINGTAWKGMTYDSKAPKKTGVIHLLR